MNNKLTDIRKTLLMGPGTSSVSPNVYKALSTYTVGHLDKRFLDIMDDTKEMLREMLRTTNQLTLPISGTGTAAMESCFVNLIEESDKILIVENGYFGSRMVNMCQRLKADVDVLNFSTKQLYAKNLYMGFSKTDKGKKLVAEFDKRLPELIDDGTMQQLYNKWGLTQNTASTISMN